MKKEIDIFGWKYKPSNREMSVIQAIMVFTVMCLILTKGLRSPLAYKIYGSVSFIGVLTLLAQNFIN
ncbi:hypothetical protein [Acinetobacter bereziniae]|uniref:hypothetical protein n=1 Tax=Acinetobacter bereziniae TaxID=106648 RepID=UPI000287B0E3|nr:hypothetical protein [Acinetobacter bereziniae]MBJ8450177.1 hypothetical protein [Acinetobacter bereziniae]MBJ8454788.1 hypothetical protein [Acinetobacter bereziniae]MBJ9906308.1 hypothetical protein [Acinetobacter bereziniae]MBJ9927171.1 hypothetical protein [Acinetobacter bereziniae]MCU4418664.1 hypothetical protein [Acinetobacter bereziniae]